MSNLAHLETIYSDQLLDHYDTLVRHDLAAAVKNISSPTIIDFGSFTGALERELVATSITPTCLVGVEPISRSTTHSTGYTDIVHQAGAEGLRTALDLIPDGPASIVFASCLYQIEPAEVTEILRLASGDSRIRQIIIGVDEIPDDYQALIHQKTGVELWDHTVLIHDILNDWEAEEIFSGFVTNSPTTGSPLLMRYTSYSR